MYSILVVAYLFLGGAAGGAFLVMSAWSLYFHVSKEYHRSSRIRQAFRSMKTACYSVSLVMLLAAMACLFFDLGVPENVHLFFTRPHATPITFGAFSLGIEAIVGFMLVVANALRPKLLAGRAKAVLEALCVASSLCVMVYAGLYLFNQAAVPAWHTVWLVALFFFSAASGGASTMLLVDYFIQGQTLLLQTVRPLQKAHVVCLIGEAIALAFYAGRLFATPAAADAVALLMEPSMLRTALLGAVGMGIVVPLCLELYALFKRDSRQIPLSDVICLIGGLCLRWCVVMCATH